MTKRVLSLLVALTMLAAMDLPTFAEDVSSEIGVTSEIMATPEMTEAPATKETLEVTEAPEIKETPEISEEPDVEETPEPTEIPEIEKTPEVADTPEPTEALEVEETPEPTEVPEVEATPEIEELPEEEEELEQEENPIETLANSGTYGKLNWKFENGTLTISGSGPMKDAEAPFYSPWNDYWDVCTSVVIKSGVTSIGIGAFNGLSSMKSVTIPSTVTSIGRYAFSECSALKSISIPTSVKSIGVYAFEECESLTSVTIPSGVTEIGMYTFSNCTSLAKVTIPSSVKFIGQGAFAWCESLTGISLPKGITTISSFTFSECTALASISIPSGVTSIEQDAFSGCTALKSVSIPDSVTYIDHYAFEFCESLKSVSIPSKVTYIGYMAFAYCYCLTNVSIPTSVTVICEKAFQGCTSLTDISIRNSNCTIGDDSTALGDPKKTTVHGSAKSTAQAYAKKYGYKFVADIPDSNLATPKLTSVTNTATGIKIVWGKVSGATRYRVYYRVGTSGSFKKLVNTSAGSYTWTGAKSGTTYNFTVRCIDSAGNAVSSYDSKGLSVTYVAAPKLNNLSVTSTGIKISWGKVTGASRYRVYYRTGTSGAFQKLINTSASSYTWTGAKAGTTYNFTVRCLDSNGKVAGSYDSKGKTVTYAATPKITSVSNVSNGVKITWNKATGASRYRVYYKTGTNGAFQKLINTSASSYTWPNAESGTKYTFTVRCLDSAGTVSSYYDTKGQSITYVAAPKLENVRNIYNGLDISWGEVTGAAKYRVYYRVGDSGAFVKLADTTETSYLWTGAKAGTSYSFTVCCLDSAGKPVSSYEVPDWTITRIDFR